MSKVALIGAGRWGKNILRNLATINALVMVCDADSKNLDFVKDNYPDIAVTNEIEDIINNPEIKGVAIATPAATHFALGMKMLDAGKDVFIEKPIVLSETDLEQLKQKAEEKDLIIMEGHLLLYHSAVRRFKKALDDDEIGKVNHIYFKRTALGAIRFESSALWDFAPHDLSVLMYLIPDMPETVYASGLKVFEKSGGEEVVFTTLKYADKIASIHESWLDPAKDRKIIAVGDQGMLMLDELAEDGKIKLFSKKVELNSEAKFEHEIFSYIDEGFKVLDYPDSEPLKEECQHFVDCITDRKKPVSNVENSQKVLRMLLQADSSLKDGEVKKI